MRPDRSNCFWADSLNAFIPVLLELKAFSFKNQIFHSALVSQSDKPFREKLFHETKLKDQFMFKKILFAVALASLVLVQTSANAVTFLQSFSTNPTNDGWKVFGDTNLFEWNSTNQNLEVTWDSSKPNSYFHRSLGTILAKDDDFSLALDLRLSDIAIGVDTNKPFTFQIAVGFLNFNQATNINFLRGSGFQSPNLVEFNYFPDSGFGNTITTPIISSNNGYAGFSFTLLEITPNDLFHIEMNYSASNQTLKTAMTKNGAAFGPIADTAITTADFDFRVDTVAVASYNDAGQDPMFAGSILAHAVVDNFVVTVPDSPIGNLAHAISGNLGEVQFISRTNFTYVLERTANFQTWTDASAVTVGTGANLILQDTNALPEKAFYRVRADRP
jgi:hypothetical protein